MDKRRLDEMIPLAYDAIRDNGIMDQQGQVPSGFRGQISSFGAAVAMGSLLSAVAAFSDDGKSAVDRSRLMNAIYQVIHGGKTGGDKALLFEILKTEKAALPGVTDNILTAAIAVKLALNLYPTAKDNADSTAEA
ncbi:MAG: hypothetical protein LUG65_07825 [Clostridiales bacterium]|nr:hypothetical protein [Clostridiales bacterium]